MKINKLLLAFLSSLILSGPLFATDRNEPSSSNEPHKKNVVSRIVQTCCHCFKKKPSSEAKVCDQEMLSLNMLPKDILIVIFKNLSRKDIDSLALTNNHFYQIIFPFSTLSFNKLSKKEKDALINQMDDQQVIQLTKLSPRCLNNINRTLDLSFYDLDIEQVLVMLSKVKNPDVIKGVKIQYNGHEFFSALEYSFPQTCTFNYEESPSSICVGKHEEKSTKEALEEYAQVLSTVNAPSLCVALNKRSSEKEIDEWNMSNEIQLWDQEVKKHCPNILVSTLDLTRLPYEKDELVQLSRTLSNQSIKEKFCLNIECLMKLNVFGGKYLNTLSILVEKTDEKNQPCSKKEKAKIKTFK